MFIHVQIIMTRIMPYLCKNFAVCRFRAWLLEQPKYHAVHFEVLNGLTHCTYKSEDEFLTEANIFLFQSKIFE